MFKLIKRFYYNKPLLYAVLYFISNFVLVCSALSIFMYRNAVKYSFEYCVIAVNTPIFLISIYFTLKYIIKFALSYKNSLLEKRQCEKEQ